MQLRSSANFLSFLRAVSMCKKDVWFCTEEGDRLNLKSKLSRYVFATLTAKPDMIFHADIVCDSREDYAHLQDFLIEE